MTKVVFLLALLMGLLNFVVREALDREFVAAALLAGGVVVVLRALHQTTKKRERS